jgi:hypothetical protein
VLTLFTWMVRWWFPVDECVPLLFVIPAEPANILQYVSLFALGGGRLPQRLVRSDADSTGIVWLTVGLVAVLGIYVMEPLGL